MPKGGIPDRWLAYSKVGSVIVGTPFIAFKVPLKEALCRNVEPNERFTPSSLMEQFPNLGLIIDLTFTTRYYGPAEFLARGVQHCKILCPGHGSAPRDKEVKRFTEVVDSFLEERPSEEKLVGVHCTHGLNRTGYMICRYMIDSMGFSPVEAVKAFEDARGHAIERTEYLECLGYTELSDRQPPKEKSDRRSSKNRPPGGSQEQPYHDYQPHKASRTQVHHIPSNYGWSKESERLGDPYQHDGRSGNVQRGSYMYEQQHGSHFGNVQRGSYHQPQYDIPSGNVHRSSFQPYQYNSGSGNVQSGSYQQFHYDTRFGNEQRDSYQQCQYDIQSGNVHKGGYQPPPSSSGSYQNNSDSYHVHHQGGQPQKEYRGPSYNPGRSSGQQSSGDDRFKSKTYNPDCSQQKGTTTTQISSWF